MQTVVITYYIIQKFSSLAFITMFYVGFPQYTIEQIFGKSFTGKSRISSDRNCTQWLVHRGLNFRIIVKLLLQFSLVIYCQNFYQLGSLTKTRGAFRERFPEKKTAIKTIRYNISKFKRHSSSHVTLMACCKLDVSKHL